MNNNRVKQGSYRTLEINSPAGIRQISIIGCCLAFKRCRKISLGNQQQIWNSVKGRNMHHRIRARWTAGRQYALFYLLGLEKDHKVIEPLLFRFHVFWQIQVVHRLPERQVIRHRGQGVHCITLIPTSIVKFEWCLRRELFSIRAETTIPMLHESNVWCLFALSKKDTNVTPAATQHMWEKCRGSNLFCKNVHNNPKIKEDSKKIMQPHRAPFLYQQKPKTTE